MTTITINAWCRRCGIAFTADRASVIAGTWRYCRDCREAASPPGPPVPRRHSPSAQHREVAA